MKELQKISVFILFLGAFLLFGILLHAANNHGASFKSGKPNNIKKFEKKTEVGFVPNIFIL